MLGESRSLKRAIWVDKKKKDILGKSLNSDYVQALKETERKFLTDLLLSLLYAERLLKGRGKKLTLWLEALASVFGLSNFGATVGMWNFHVVHAGRFGYSTKQFRKLLQDDGFSTEIVIRHLVEDIKLNKSPDRIFAEYNVNKMATAVAALQKALNFLLNLENPLLEDGTMGPQTLKAIEENLHLFPSFFSLRKLNESMIIKTLKFFSRKYGIYIKPYVPQVVIQKNWQFIKKILKSSLKDIFALKKLKAFFERNIDVPTYVARAMRAYKFLNKV